MPDRVAGVDRLQRRHRVLGVPIAVVYKFFDDQGGYLAVVLTHYALVAILPLLLIASSVLGFVLQGHPELQQKILSSALAQFPIVGDQLGRPGGLRGSTSAVVVNTVILALMMRWATPQKEHFRAVVPGAALIAVLWQLLQALGGIYVSRVIANAGQMNGVFAIVLGLVALLYVASVMAMLGLETNVVIAKHLYPRALLTPFTDAVQLTEADRRVYREYAKAQRHKGFERVHVDFDESPDDAET